MVKIEIFPLKGIHLIKQGEDVSEAILQALEQQALSLQDDDILVIAHTIISKAEGRVVRIDDVRVSEKAKKIAEREGFDPIHVEIAIQESKRILRERRTLITETLHGYICNFSGVDRSNAPENTMVLLPENPDESAKRIWKRLVEALGKRIAVIVSDTEGRPWRRGAINIAIGCAGINAFKYNRGRKDLYGRKLYSSTVCHVDEIASAAELVMGQADEGNPVIVVRGYKFTDGNDTALDIIRPAEEDLFR